MLNKQGPEKIDWTDFSWNPIQGVCHHACPYCYMKRFWKMSGNPEPHLNIDYLKDRFPQKPSRIFVGSSTDMWGNWVSGKSIQMVLDSCEKLQDHTFQFLTKNPARYFDFKPIKNAWYGTTVDGLSSTKENVKRLIACAGLFNIRFISFEPLLLKIDPDLSGIDWVIIGANSNKGAAKPKKEWADLIIEKAKENKIPVWVKDNYGYPEKIKEFPIKKGEE